MKLEQSESKERRNRFIPLKRPSGVSKDSETVWNARWEPQFVSSQLLLPSCVRGQRACHRQKRARPSGASPPLVRPPDIGEAPPPRAHLLGAGKAAGRASIANETVRRAPSSWENRRRWVRRRGCLLYACELRCRGCLLHCRGLHELSRGLLRPPSPSAWLYSEEAYRGGRTGGSHVDAAPGPGSRWASAHRWGGWSALLRGSHRAEQYCGVWPWRRWGKREKRVTMEPTTD